MPGAILSKLQTPASFEREEWILVRRCLSGWSVPVMCNSRGRCDGVCSGPALRAMIVGVVALTLPMRRQRRVVDWGPGRAVCWIKAFTGGVERCVSLCCWAPALGGIAAFVPV